MQLVVGAIENRAPQTFVEQFRRSSRSSWAGQRSGSFCSWGRRFAPDTVQPVLDPAATGVDPRIRTVIVGGPVRGEARALPDQQGLRIRAPESTSGLLTSFFWIRF